MIDKRIVLLLAFLNFIIVSLCLTVIIRDKINDRVSKTQILKISNARDSLLDINATLTAKGRLLELEAQDLQNRIDVSTQNIQDLKNKRHEKIIQLDTMYVDDLVRFFAGLKTQDTIK